MFFEVKLKLCLFCYVFTFLATLIASDTRKQESELAELLYKKWFKQQRAEQLDAVKKFQKISNYEKQYSMITLMGKEIFENILESKEFLETSHYTPAVSYFPLDPKTKESLSIILENTALFSEMVLRFPDISISILKKNDWDECLQWAIAFSFQMQNLLDESTVKLLQLVCQELDYVERDSDYFNPYRKKLPDKEETVKLKPQKKKKKLKKGPKLSGHFEL